MQRKEKTIKTIIKIVLLLLFLSWFFGFGTPRCTSSCSPWVYLGLAIFSAVRLLVFFVGLIILFIPFSRTNGQDPRRSKWVTLMAVSVPVGVLAFLFGISSLIGDSSDTPMLVTGITISVIALACFVWAALHLRKLT